MLLKYLTRLWHERACEAYAVECDRDLDIAPDADTVRFLILGDTGSGSDNQRRVARASEQTALEKGCDFVLFAGDNFIQTGITSIHDPQLDEKFESMYHLDLPFYAILGNHDLRGNWKAQIDYTLHSRRWHLPGTNYHFNAGPVFIQAINTTCSLRTLWQIYRKSPRPWHMVVGHHPVISSGRHGGMLPLERIIVGMSPIDFFVSGHNHALEHTHYRKFDQIVSGGGGSPIESARDARLKNTLFYRECHGYIWAEITADTAAFDYFDADGETIYRFSKTRRIPASQV